MQPKQSLGSTAKQLLSQHTSSFHSQVSSDLTSQDTQKRLNVESPHFSNDASITEFYSHQLSHEDSCRQNQEQV